MKFHEKSVHTVVVFFLLISSRVSQSWRFMRKQFSLVLECKKRVVFLCGVQYSLSFSIQLQISLRNGPWREQFWSENLLDNNHMKVHLKVHMEERAFKFNHCQDGLEETKRTGFLLVWTLLQGVPTTRLVETASGDSHRTEAFVMQFLWKVVLDEVRDVTESHDEGFGKAILRSTFNKEVIKESALASNSYFLEEVRHSHMEEVTDEHSDLCS